MTETAEMMELKEFGWCILELMGHRTRVGQVAEQLVAGSLMLRIDIPAGEDHVSEFYNPSAVYSIQPISEEIAQKEMEGRDPRPMRPVDYRDQETKQLGFDEEDPF